MGLQRSRPSPDPLKVSFTLKPLELLDGYSLWAWCPRQDFLRRGGIFGYSSVLIEGGSNLSTGEGSKRDTQVSSTHD